ncbi:hypothetical protein Pmani_007668 [Petrolisthes manimaculis]|uniref:Uncharacterized protein n=1 Tax=Petrolisthes manimaculis TaxID=1843537 RepID=A0AAE1Q8C7_9EUCA|nr:hypothetical protein Pmani_007668 [Petrolisthes manimaculis]
MSQEDLAGLTCGICREYYQDGFRSPVSIPCGHTFCRDCLRQVDRHQQTNDGFCCPTCRTPHPDLPNIYRLPPNFAILSLLDSFKIVGGERPRRCEVHKCEDLLYWCQPCATLLCGLCISTCHRSPDHHIIISVDSAKREKRRWMEQVMREMNEKLDTRFKNHLTDTVDQLFHLSLKSTRLTEVSDAMVHTEATINASSVGIEKILASEEKIHELQSCLEDIEKDTPTSTTTTTPITTTTTPPTTPTTTPATTPTPTTPTPATTPTTTPTPATTPTTTPTPATTPTTTPTPATTPTTITTPPTPTPTTTPATTPTTPPTTTPPPTTPTTTTTSSGPPQSSSIVSPKSSDESTSDDMVKTCCSADGPTVTTTTTTTTTTLGDLSPELIRTEKIRKIDMCQVRYRHERLGKLVGVGKDKLALHAFSGQILSGHFTIDWPVMSPHVPLSECRVFLDLVTNFDRERIGRVTIKVWDHLRRARHFLGLCLGLWGSSYRKSTLLRVQDTEYCKFMVSGGHYDESTGITSTEGLMHNLEWAGEYTGFDRVGQVVAFGGGRAHLDAVFGICLEENVPGGRSRCPFGVVEEGLGVMRKAACFMSASTAVQISDCGIIFNVAPMNSSAPGQEEIRNDEGTTGLSTL